MICLCDVFLLRFQFSFICLSQRSVIIIHEKRRQGKIDPPQFIFSSSDIRSMMLRVSEPFYLIPKNLTVFSRKVCVRVSMSFSLAIRAQYDVPVRVSPDPCGRGCAAAVSIISF